MALSFPNPATQTPVNTYSPTSTPAATTNGITYTWDSALGVWLAAAGGGGGGGGVTSVAVTAPITDTGTATAPNLGISAATTSAAGSVQLATAAEAATGTNASKSLTPATGVPKDAAGMTGAAIIPGGDDAERTAIATPVAGMLRYNDQGGVPADMEFYDGAGWSTLSTGKAGMVSLATINVAGAATVDFKSLMDPTKYSGYLFIGTELTESTGGFSTFALNAVASTDNGATWLSDSAASKSSFYPLTGNSVTTEVVTYNSSSFRVVFQIANTTPHSFTLFLTGRQMTSVSYFYNGGAAVNGAQYSAGLYPNPPNAIRFQMAANNLASGTISMYGYTK